MFNNKLFKNTEKRKFFVSDELKILSANGSSVVLVDTMEQEWKVNTNNFFSFVLDNKIKIENNVLKERIVIDCYMSMRLPKDFYDWTEKNMENQKIETFDLIPGNIYITDEGTKYLYLDTKYIGEYKIIEPKRELKESKIYKKHLFLYLQENETVTIYNSHFILKTDKNLPKFINSITTDKDVKKYIDLFKLIGTIYYYSDIQKKEGKIEFEKIEVEEISLKIKHFNVALDLFVDFDNETFFGLKGHIVIKNNINNEEKINRELEDIKNNIHSSAYFSIFKKEADNNHLNYDMYHSFELLKRNTIFKNKSYIVPKLNS